MITNGTINSTSPVSLSEVKAMNKSPPIMVSMLRRANEMDDEITDRISVVSVVSRESTSPVITRSKNGGLMAMTRA